MPYLGTPPQSGFITTAKQRVTSSTNNYVDLDHSISSIADVIVFVNFVKQDTTNLTLTTSTRITLGGTLVSSDIVEIHYLGKAVNTQTPATGTVTNDMLAGSIANSKLANSSITLNGSAVSLGGSASVGISNYFFAWDSDTGGTSGNIVLDQTEINSGSNYNTSTGLYTAPSAGDYFFMVNFRRGGTGAGDLYFRKNGSNVTSSYYRHSDTSNTAATFSIILTLASSDTMGFYSANNVNPSHCKFLGWKLT